MAADCYWPTEMVQMLRALINDLDPDNYTYTDSRLTDLLLAAAMVARQEVKFATTYTVTLLGRDISPDPSDPSDKDYNFITMVTLKAACMIDVNDIRQKAQKEGVKAVCGPISAELKSGGKSYDQVLAEGPCDMYAQLKEKINFIDPMENAEGFRAILSPFTSNTFKASHDETGRSVR